MVAAFFLELLQARAHVIQHPNGELLPLVVTDGLPHEIQAGLVHAD